MLDTERFFIWTYRYNDNDELAILACKNAFQKTSPDILTNDITRLIRTNELVDIDRGFRPVGGFSSAEWKTWAAFKLCSVIEVYLIDDKDGTNRVLKWSAAEV